MHAVTPPKDKKNIIKLPPQEPWKVSRGHRPHRGRGRDARGSPDEAIINSW